ncbi:MAG: hypothetical protein AAF282_06575 [Cyanobacteria bacterium P01_A01_bin.15]
MILAVQKSYLLLPTCTVTATQSSSSPVTLYGTDYMKWITTTVDKLRRQDYNHVD